MTSDFKKTFRIRNKDGVAVMKILPEWERASFPVELVLGGHAVLDPKGVREKGLALLQEMWGRK
jgi:hypothetical protein